MQRPASVVQEAESTCLGAGMLAAAACGIYEDIKDAAEGMSGTRIRFDPDEGRAATYARLYDVYKEIYLSLRPFFPEAGGSSKRLGVWIAAGAGITGMDGRRGVRRRRDRGLMCE